MSEEATMENTCRGDRVIHCVFGQGTVIDYGYLAHVSKDHPAHRLQICFDNGMIKEFWWEVLGQRLLKIDA